MKIRIEYTTRVTDEYRQAINFRCRRPGRASREQVRTWLIENGHSLDDEIIQELRKAKVDAGLVASQETLFRGRDFPPSAP